MHQLESDFAISYCAVINLASFAYSGNIFHPKLIQRAQILFSSRFSNNFSFLSGNHSFYLEMS